MNSPKNMDDIILDYLEELCGGNQLVNLSETSTFSVKLAREVRSSASDHRPSSCHGLLNFRWPTYQELWISVNVRNLSFALDYNTHEHGGCNAVQGLQVKIIYHSMI